MPRLTLSVLSTRRKISSLSMAVLSLLIILFEMPILSRTTSNVITYGLMMLFLLLNINVFVNAPNSKKNLIYLVGIYFIFIVVYKVFGISSADISHYSATIKFLYICVVFIGIFDALSTGQKKYLLALSIAVIIYVIIDNYGLYRMYGAVRFTRLFATERFTTNSVSTAFVTAYMFVSGAMFVLFLQAKGIVRKSIALTACLIIVYFNFAIAQRTIILLLTVPMFFLLIISNIRSQRTFWGMISIVLVVIPLMMFCYEDILYTLSEMTGSNRIQKRITQVVAAISQGNMLDLEGSGGSRLDLMMVSVRTFFSSIVSFFFGAGDHRSMNDVIGNHSLLIDEFARYGIFGGIMMINMLRLLLKAMVQNSRVSNDITLRRQILIFEIFIYIRGMLGALFDAQIALVFLMIIPISFNLIGEKKNSLV